MIAAIRVAERRDIPAIARLHVASWRESYRGIVPDQTLQGLDVPSRERMWHEAMGDVPASREVVVAEALLRHTEESVGFASCGPAWDSDLNTDGEIEAVYVLNRAQYRGIGTRLMGAAAATLAARGMQSVGLWCARDNMAAIAFCRALGGRIAGLELRPFAGLMVPSVAVVWREIADLTMWDEPEPKSRRDDGRSADDAQSRRAVPRSCRPDACLPA